MTHHRSALCPSHSGERARFSVRPLREPIQSPAVNSGGQQKDDFIKPSRPTVADPADIQKAGVLQLEFGLDASFDAEEFRSRR